MDYNKLTVRNGAYVQFYVLKSLISAYSGGFQRVFRGQVVSVVI